MHVCVDILNLFLNWATALTESQTDHLKVCDLKKKRIKQMGF